MCLHGEQGDDFLYGEDGDDALDGGAGVDYLFGGTGNNTYVDGIVVGDVDGDVAIEAFVADGVDLRIRYDVTEAPANAFTLDVYASSDGVTLDQLLTSLVINESSDLAIGSHDVALPALGEISGDYQLLADKEGNDPDSSNDQK